MSAAASPPQLAAVDLGTNSFHLVVVRPTGPDGEFQVLDRLKVPVRLGEGLDADDHLRPDAQDRALACLEQFGQRLQGLPRGAVRAVGTNTLRRARNALPFLTRARAALGHKIEVITGTEEARLIFRGVNRDLSGPGRRLVVDIGGGSTELIVGDPDGPLLLESREMGCVRWTQRYFPKGQISEKAYEEALVAARLQLRECARPLRRLGWAQAAGSSGTIRAVGRALEAVGRPGPITAAGIAALAERLIEAKRVDKAVLPGIGGSRASVFPGGLAILAAVFADLQLEGMAPAPSALREGVILELLGGSPEDVRAAAVTGLCRRAGVDLPHARRVRRTAEALFDEVAAAWSLTRHRHRCLLGWAAELHEVGVFINHDDNHVHGAYLVRHAELPGFNRQDQAALSALVLAAHGDLDEARLREEYPGRTPPLLRLAAVLRIAIRLHRSRSERDLPPLRLQASGDALQLGLPDGYLAAHPLTRADLQAEQRDLAAAGLTLLLTGVPDEVRPEI